MARLMSISQHCSELAFALVAIGRPRRFMPTSQWLETASGIRSIRFDLARYDQDAAWCSTAYGHLVEREKQLARFTRDLAVFLFIWASLEALLDESCLSDAAAPEGKINQACGHITSNEPRVATPVCYAEELSRLYTCNRFAHGSAFFCQRDTKDLVFDHDLLRNASRVILLSIQMIVSLLFGDDEEIAVSWRQVSQERAYRVRDFLRSLHVVGAGGQHGQVGLFAARDS